MLLESLKIAQYLYMREYNFTPLANGSPYCPAVLGFLHVARRGGFQEPAIDAWTNRVYEEQAIDSEFRYQHTNINCEYSTT